MVGAFEAAQLYLAKQLPNDSIVAQKFLKMIVTFSRLRTNQLIQGLIRSNSSRHQNWAILNNLWRFHEIFSPCRSSNDFF